MTTTKEFNTEYANYIETGFDGMEIGVPSVIHYINTVFKDLVKIPGFKYSQIKTKFGLPRVYTNLDELLPFVGRIINNELEEKISLLLKVEFEVEQRLLSLNIDKNGKPLQSL
jgi:hypothetical protein